MSLLDKPHGVTSKSIYPSLTILSDENSTCLRDIQFPHPGQALINFNARVLTNRAIHLFLP